MLDILNNKAAGMEFSFWAKKDNYVISDHQFLHQPCIPGVSFIEILYNYLVGKGFDTRTIAIENLIFLKPVILKDGAPIKVSVMLTKTPKGYTVKGKTDADDIFQCSIVKYQREEESISPKELIDKADTVYDMEEAYELTRLAGIYHYDFMKLRGKVYKGDGYLLAEVKMGEKAKEYLDSFVLHPAILDGATVACGLLYTGVKEYDDSKGVGFLPFCVMRYYAYGLFESEDYYIYITTQNTKKTGGGIFYNNIEIYDAMGSSLGIYEQFGTKLIRQSKDEAVENGETLSAQSNLYKEEIRDKFMESSLEEFLKNQVNKLTDSEITQEEYHINFFDIGLDSRQLLQLSEILENKLNIHTYPTLLFEYPNIKELAAYLKGEYGEEILAEEQLSKNVTENKPSSRSFEDIIRGLISQLISLEEKKIDPDTSFYELGLDSRQLIELVKQLEEIIGEGLYPTLLFEYNSLGTLAGYLEENYGSIKRKFRVETRDKKYNPVVETETSNNIDISAAKAEISSKREIPVVKAEPSSNREIPVVQTEISDNRHISVFNTEVSNKSDFSVLNTEVSSKSDFSGVNAEASSKRVIPVVDAEASSKRNIPVVNTEISSKRANPLIKDELRNLPPKKLTDMLYTTTWTEEKDLSAYASESENIFNSTLIVYTDKSQELAEYIKHTLLKGRIYKLHLTDYESAEEDELTYTLSFDNISLFKDIYKQMEEVTSVVLLNGIETEINNSILSVTEYETIEKQGILSIFKIMKVLQKSVNTSCLKNISIVTNNVLGISETERRIPYHGAIHGFIRSLSKEMSRIHFATLDIDLEEVLTEKQKDYFGKLLLSVTDTKGEELVIRKNKVYKRKAKKSKVKNGNSRFRDKGVYVIIGGSGGVGRALSHYLAQQYRAQLIWIGRSEISESIITARTEIENLGGNLRYIQGNISKEVVLEEIFDRIEADTGQIHGVFHSALVLEDKMFQFMPLDSLLRVLEPKTKGLISLYHGIKNRNLDFFMLFSSIQSFLGNVGQSNYASASTFLDAFAACISQVAEFDVKVINWGFWGDIGVASGGDYDEIMQKSGSIPIRAKEGIPLIETILSGNIKQISTINFIDEVLIKYGIQPGKDNQEVKFLNIESDGPSDTFLYYWSNIRKGNGINHHIPDLTNEFLTLYNEKTNPLLHALVSDNDMKQMEIVICGKGEKVLLFNGFGLTQAQWYFQLKELKEQYQFICINIPGVGLSFGDSNTEFENICHMFAKTLDIMGLTDKFHLVGTSFGGMVAQVFAAIYPELTKSLVLVNSCLDIRIDSEKDSLADKMREDFKEIGYNEEFQYILNAEMTNGELIRYIEHNERGFHVELYTDKVKCPVRFINGSLDTVFSAEKRSKLMSCYKKAGEILISGAGHAPYISHSREFNQALTESLDNI